MEKIDHTLIALTVGFVAQLLAVGIAWGRTGQKVSKLEECVTKLENSIYNGISAKLSKIDARVAEINGRCLARHEGQAHDRDH